MTRMTRKALALMRIVAAATHGCDMSPLQNAFIREGARAWLNQLPPEEVEHISTMEWNSIDEVLVLALEDLNGEADDLDDGADREARP